MTVDDLLWVQAGIHRLWSRLEALISLGSIQTGRRWNKS
jgi:hypothetical protein